MDIQEIVFIKKEVFSPRFLFKIYTNGESYFLDFTTLKFGNEAADIQTLPMVNFDAINFLDHFFRIISDWKEKYCCYAQLDGTEWGLLIQYKDGYQKTFDGKASYPNNFSALEDLIHLTIQQVSRS